MDATTFAPCPRDLPRHLVVATPPKPRAEEAEAPVHPLPRALPGVKMAIPCLGAVWPCHGCELWFFLCRGCAFLCAPCPLPPRNLQHRTLPTLPGAQAPFEEGAVYLFLTTAEAGIERIPGDIKDLTVAGLTRYLGFKLSPITDHQRSLVHTFKSEKAFKALGTPVLVKFYKQSCPHCIHYVGTFQRGGCRCG